MSKNSSVAFGVVGFFLLLIIPNYVFLAANVGGNGLAYFLGYTVILLAVVGIGVKMKGMEFFGILGEMLDEVTKDSSKPSGTPKGNKVPRPPTYWTNKMVEAVGGVCEVQSCRQVTHLQVHHINPHAKGGSNRLTNLMVACPKHHKDCDTGAINATRQKAVIQRNGRFKETDFPRKWQKAVIDKESSPTSDGQFEW